MADFQIDPFKFEKDMFRTGSMRQIRWCHFYFRISHIKKVINGISSPRKTITFHLMTSGAKPTDLWSNLIEKRYRGTRRAPQCFFLFRIRPCFHTFGDKSDCMRKSRFFKIWHFVTSGDLNIDLTWKWPSVSLRSRQGLSYTIYRLSLNSVVFEIWRGGAFEASPGGRFGVGYDPCA